MKLISSGDLINITEKTFSHVDNRLTGHSRRVAYIVFSVMAHTGKYTAEELNRYFLMALLHDIGAVKTDEIDTMLSFDSEDAWEHAVYGALFLQTFMPMLKDTHSILYHHLAYQNYDKDKYALPQEYAAGIICLADRIDLFLRCSSERDCVKMILNERGKHFSPYWVDAFLALNNSHRVIEKLLNDVYIEEFAQIANDFKFTKNEKEQALEMLAYSIDFRSSFMVMHTVTTVSISTTLAKLFGLSEEQCYDITFGAYLHDVGKVASPVEILEKAGQLTAEEMNIMRSHVELTRFIIEDWIKPSICEIASRHHERLDGSGYPQGLTKEQLSLEECIMAVADVMSALVRRRSYKDAFDKERTLSILAKTRDAGQLCPMVVNMIINNFDAVLDQAERESIELMDRYASFKDEYTRVIDGMRKSGAADRAKQIQELSL